MKLKHFDFSNFNKMALLSFQYGPASLNVNKVCFDEEQDIHKIREKSRTDICITEWYRCGKCGEMKTNVECLSCSEVEALGYLQLSDIRQDDRNVVNKKVSKTVL